MGSRPSINLPPTPPRMPDLTDKLVANAGGVQTTGSRKGSFVTAGSSSASAPVPNLPAPSIKPVENLAPPKVTPAPAGLGAPGNRPPSAYSKMPWDLHAPMPPRRPGSR
jgi:hypothetical protein